MTTRTMALHQTCRREMFGCPLRRADGGPGLNSLGALFLWELSRLFQWRRTAAPKWIPMGPSRGAAIALKPDPTVADLTPYACRANIPPCSASDPAPGASMS